MDRGTRHRDAGRRGLFGNQVGGLAASSAPCTVRGVARCLRGVALVMLVGLAVAACGSSSSSSSSDPSGSSGSSAPSSSTASTSATSAANLAAAQAGVAAFSGKPSAFPVSEPLKKPLPVGSKFVYLEASDPIGALLGTLLKPAVQAVGGTFVAIPAGNSASAAQAAASTAIADKPAAVLIPAFLPSEFAGKLQALRSEGASIVGAGMVGWQHYGIQSCVNCDAYETQMAKLLADWAVAKQGAKTDAVFYTVPELSFTALMWKTFKAQVATLCPKCTARSLPIDVSTIGTTAPQTIVNDLQSNSSTNVAVFSTMDMAQGLPAALSAAGLHVLTIGQAPTPENLQDIKDGKLTAGVGSDLPSLAWTMVDAGARLATGQQPQASEGFTPIQVLEQKDITFDPTHGWTGYPDFAQRYAKLWHPHG